MEKKTKDFWFSIFLALFSLFVIVSGYQIVHESYLSPYNIESFMLSPGLLPVVLGYVLLFCCILLFLQSTKSQNTRKETIIAHVNESKRWAESLKTNPNVFYTVGGVLIIFLYTFVLLANLSFIISSVIFLIILMMFLHATNIWKIAIISIITVALIVLLFQVCFNTVLP
jgi:hypothetical protein